MGLDDMVSVASKWHVKTVAWLGLLVAIAVGALAFGFAPWLFPGFVRHDELDRLVSAQSQTQQTVLTRLDSMQTQIQTSVAAEQGQIDVITKAAIETSIRAKISSLCMTTDRAYKAELSESIQKLEDEYFNRFHQGYRQPSCSEL